MLKRTVLFDAHARLGARLIDFGGWEMPLQYTGIVDEHLAVRRAAGLFDISHMGQAKVSGGGALVFLNRVLTNDVRRLAIGQGQYTLMCNEQGGVIDDLYLYRVAEVEYVMILNASRTDVDVAWLAAQQRRLPEPEVVRLSNLSLTHGGLAVQGPVVSTFIDSCLGTGSREAEGRLADMQKNEIRKVRFEATELYAARTGYTGEDGFEVFGPTAVLEAVWNRLLGVGRERGIKPCGLGARDTLRTQMGYPLYGHELDESTTPLEAGLGAFVAWDKGAFVGGERLLRQKEQGIERKCVAFVMAEGAPPPRPGYAVWSAGVDGGVMGRVVSGTQSPSLGRGIGLGYVPRDQSRPGTELGIEIRGRRYGATVVAKPVYRGAGGTAKAH